MKVKGVENEIWHCFTAVVNDKDEKSQFIISSANDLKCLDR